MVCTLTVAAWDTLVLSPRTWRLMKTSEWPILKILFHFLRVFMAVEFTIVGAFRPALLIFPDINDFHPAAVAFFDTRFTQAVRFGAVLITHPGAYSCAPTTAMSKFLPFRTYLHCYPALRCIQYVPVPLIRPRSVLIGFSCPCCSHVCHIRQEPTSPLRNDCPARHPGRGHGYRLGLLPMYVHFIDFLGVVTYLNFAATPLDVGQGCIASPKHNWVGIYWVAPTLLYTVSVRTAYQTMCGRLSHPSPSSLWRPCVPRRRSR